MDSDKKKDDKDLRESKEEVADQKTPADLSSEEEKVDVSPEGQPASEETARVPDYRQQVEKMSDEELAALFEKADKASLYLDGLQRSHAEYENYQKRVQRERTNFMKYAPQDLLSKLTVVLDLLERALFSASTSQAEEVQNLAKGVDLVYQHLRKILMEAGLVPIECKGARFDPRYHEAIQQIQSADFPEMTVVEELEKGYLFYERILRASKVVVSRKPTQPAEAEKQSRIEEK